MTSLEGYGFLWRDEVIAVVSFISFNWANFQRHRRILLADYWVDHVDGVCPCMTEDRRRGLPTNKSKKKRQRKCRLAVAVVVLFAQLTGAFTIWLYYRHPSPERVPYIITLVLYIFYLTIGYMHEFLLPELQKAEQRNLQLAMESIMALTSVSMWGMLIYEVTQLTEEDDYDVQMISAVILWLLNVVTSVSLWLVVVKMYCCCAVASPTTIDLPRITKKNRPKDDIV